MDLQFLSGLLSIVMIDIVLGGDNAILIALATRRLSSHQRKKAIFWGVFGAIAIRAVLTAIAVYVLSIPFIHFTGGVLLVWIANKLLKDEDQHEDVSSGKNIFEAIKTIIIADLLMGVDNVLAVAGAAHGHILLVVLGLLISIPIIVWGSNIILYFIERYPFIIYFGAGIIAWTAGKMIVEDQIIHKMVISQFPALAILVPLAITILIIIKGFYSQKNKATFNRI